jgi:hypothetical protein
VGSAADIGGSFAALSIPTYYPSPTLVTEPAPRLAPAAEEVPTPRGRSVATEAPSVAEPIPPAAQAAPTTTAPGRVGLLGALAVKLRLLGAPVVRGADEFNVRVPRAAAAEVSTAEPAAVTSPASTASTPDAPALTQPVVPLDPTAPAVPAAPTTAGPTAGAPSVPGVPVSSATQSATFAGNAALVHNPSGPAFQVSGPSFADVSAELGLEVPGTIRYRSTAAAAAGARAGGLVTPTRPGFQSHSTASSVRREFGVTGAAFQSAHIVPQALYRALRAAGRRVIAGRPISEGRAFTTLLPTSAHAAFDRTWVSQWNAAVAAGRAITAEDVYNWVSSAIQAVDEDIINAGVKGAINDRLRTEMFVDLNLDPQDIIVPRNP